METLKMAMDKVRFELLKINTYVLVDHYDQMFTELVLSNVMMEIMLMEMDVAQHELLNQVLYDQVVLNQ